MESKDICDRTPLAGSARNGHETMVRLLVEKGVNPEPKEDDGRTQLWEAVVRLPQSHHAS
jgi:ankyrin repeat protein